MTESAVERPAWMHKSFRYPPSSPEAVAARALCVPGPDWVPNLQAENRRMLTERAELLATMERMRGALTRIAALQGTSGAEVTGSVSRYVFANEIARAALTTGEEK